MTTKLVLKLCALLVTGGVAVCAALWLVEHRAAIPNSGYVLAALMGAFFVTYSWALFSVLAARDRARLARRAALEPPSLYAAPAGTVYALVPGQRYVVRVAFTDFHGQRFDAGERLTFRQRNFLPYDGGHTIAFDERLLYLQEDQNRTVLDNFDAYLQPL